MSALTIALLVSLVCGGAAYALLDTWVRHGRLRARLARMTQPTESAPAEDDAPVEKIAERPWEVQIRRSLAHSGLRLRPSEFVLLCAACPALLGLLGIVLTHQALVAGVTTALGAAAPWLALRRGEEARRRRFDSQLPDTLALFVSALRSGYSLARAAQMAAEEMPPPMSEEFALALAELALGLPLAEALTRMAARAGSADWDLVVTAITTQQQTGGNLAEILARIADTIRERVRVQGEIGTLTAEGKLSGLILTLLPPTLVLVLTLRDPHYFQPLLDAPIGHVLIGGAIAGQIVGAALIHRMVRLDL